MPEPTDPARPAGATSPGATPGPAGALAGSVALVTGGNSGVGLHTAIGLARLGARVLLTARDPARGTAALGAVRDATGRDAELVTLDLASVASIRAAADDVLARTERLDVLVNNAGAVHSRRRETADGFELTFGVNHLGHFLLTSRLLHRLLESAPARVITVASHAHHYARRGLVLDDLQRTRRRYSGFGAYAESKLANILFADELARRLDGTGVTSHSLHPGFVASRFARDGDTRWGTVGTTLGRPFAISPERGARTPIWLAAAPEGAETSGGYWYRCRPGRRSGPARDRAAAASLWDASEALVAAVDA